MIARCPIGDEGDPRFCLGARCRLTGICDHNVRLDAKAALDRIDARRSENIEEWARQLGNDLGQFTD